MNGQEFNQITYDSFGDKTYDKAVPARRCLKLTRPRTALSFAC